MKKWIAFLVNFVILFAVLYLFGVTDFHIPGTHPKTIEPIHAPQPEKNQNCASQEAITGGALLIQSYLKDQNDIKIIRISLDLAKESQQTWNIQQHEQALEKVMQRKDETYQLYVDKVKQLNTNCTAEQQTKALADFEQEAASKNRMKPLVRFAKIFVSEAQTYQQDGVIDESRLEDKILATQ